MTESLTALSTGPGLETSQLLGWFTHISCEGLWLIVYAVNIQVVTSQTHSSGTYAFTSWMIA